jgi:hypothetical protein
MNEKLPATLEGKLPMLAEHGATISIIVPTLALAFAGIWFPAASFAAAALPLIMERFIDRPKRQLMEALAKGQITDLSAEQVAQFVPMAYRFLEAAKQGEYEHNLRVLAQYLTGELKQEAPEAAHFSRMARRVEGLSQTDLKVMVLVELWFSEPTLTPEDRHAHIGRHLASAGWLQASPHNKHGLTRWEIAQALSELASRGFLIVDGASRMDKQEEYYAPAANLSDLMNRARETVVEAGREGLATATQPTT